jgi:DNA-binding Lrp family transcriptional regulator
MSAHWRDPGLVLADRWQHGFPIGERPFREIGEVHGLTERETIDTLARLIERGIVSRIGAVVRPNMAGASTLAAVSAPGETLERTARIVSSERFVTHNYEREHAINLWFVVAAPTREALAQTLDGIARRARCQVFDLRLERSYHIDLGFSLGDRSKRRAARQSATRAATARERALLAAIEDGLPLVPRPYFAIAQELGWREHEVAERLAALSEAGILSRFGCVLNHRAIGFTANAMAVWDVDDRHVDELGQRLAEHSGVTLCYRRNRSLPAWPFNLFAMVHGRDESVVRRRIAEIARACGLESYEHAILFSRRCFVQRGARFKVPPRELAA